MDEIYFFIFVVISAGVAGIGIGLSAAEKDGHTEAVKHGAAHWNIAPNGQTQFIWNTPLTNN